MTYRLVPLVLLFLAACNRKADHKGMPVLPAKPAEPYQALPLTSQAKVLADSVRQQLQGKWILEDAGNAAFIFKNDTIIYGDRAFVLADTGVYVLARTLRIKGAPLSVHDSTGKPASFFLAHGAGPDQLTGYTQVEMTDSNKMIMYLSNGMDLKLERAEQ